jgi:raffinose/stachyose/melibiose transport system substrate-binding protein
MEVYMKKVVITALMIVAVALGLSAQVTLKVLDYQDATQAGYADYKKIWDDFAAKYPNIKIEREELFNEPFHQKTEAYIASGNLPDVLYAWPSGRSAALHTGNYLKDLTPLLGADFLRNFSAASINPKGQSGGKLAELPNTVTYTTAMYANVKLLKDNKLALPKTYADLKNMVKVLQPKGIQVILMPNKDTWPMQSCLFSTVVGRLLGNSFVDNVKAGKAKFTDKAFVDALAFIKTMYDDGVISKDTIQYGYGDTPGYFAAGKSAFYIDGDWRVGAFLTDKASGKALISPADQKANFEIINFPAIPGEKFPGAISAIQGTGYGISAKADKAKTDAAVTLLKYLYSKEVMIIRLETGAFIPSRKDATSNKIEPLTSKMGAYYGTVPSSSYVLDGVLDGDNADVNDPLNNGLQEIGAGTKTPAQVASDMQAKVGK